MSTTGGLPPWSFQPCSGCGRPVPLAAHDLTCHFFDIRTRVAVAWICCECQGVLDLLGLFTSWDAAICAHQGELDDRALRYFNQDSHQPGGAELCGRLGPTYLRTGGASARDLGGRWTAD